MLGILPVVSLLLCVPLLGSSASLAQPYPFATDKLVRSSERGPAPAAGPIDPCNWEGEMTLAADGDTTSWSNSTAEAPDRVSGYSCTAWNERGGEHIYRIVQPADAAVRVTAILSNLDADLDLFLLTECNSDACLAFANQELSINLEPDPAQEKIYFLVVDGYQGASGSYTLSIVGRYPGLPDNICEPKSKVTWDIPCDPEPATFVNTIYGRDNLIESNACSPFIEQAGEAWYRLTLPSRHTLDASVTASGFDAAVWLFAGCARDPICLDFADDTVTGEAENLQFTNELDHAMQVYLAVDGFDPPQSGSEGIFDLVVDLSFPGLPLGICDTDSAVATFVNCGPPDTAMTLAGTVFGRDNLIEATCCHPSPLRGGEAWYAVTLGAGLWLSASVEPDPGTGFDAALWLFDGCGETARCLDCSDSAGTGQLEWWQFRNESQTERTCYIAVDRAEPAESESEGRFTLRLSCSETVRSEKRSFGALKNLYR